MHKFIQFMRKLKTVGYGQWHDLSLKEKNPVAKNGRLDNWIRISSIKHLYAYLRCRITFL